MKLKLLFLFLVATQVISAQTFTEMTGTPFDGATASSVAFADVDGDNDLDVLIAGRNSPSALISKLYTNDGLGNFIEMMGTPFEGVDFSSIAFADVDGDNDQDILITGVDNLFVPISKLYTNDGSGIFTEVTGTPFDGVYHNSIAFADVDGDNDQDVLITGRTSSSSKISKLYTNDGSGNFTEVTGTPFEGVDGGGSIAFADVDGDNDQDVLITGRNSSLLRISKLYTNDGSGIFTEVMGSPFEGVDLSSIAFADVDGDNDQDVLITGETSSSAPISKLYTNDGSGNFSEMTGTSIVGVEGGSIAFADVDSDNDQDVLIAGINSSFAQISKLYTNDGSGNYTEMTGTPFDGVDFSSIAFADVDSDNDQDVLIVGRSSFGPISKLYTNDGGTSSTDDFFIGSSLEFMLFPNPSTLSTLFMSYDPAEMSEVNISVHDVNGCLLIQQKEFIGNGQQTISIDISFLPKGIYFFELDNGKNRGVENFIVH